MSYSHGICGRNNPNCGRGVGGCDSKNEPDEQEFDDAMHESLYKSLNFVWDTNESVLDGIADAVSNVEDEAGDYKDWLVDNELYEALKRVLELAGK
jgi:hypothetical protein